MSAQALAALSRANEIRMARAELKRTIAAGKLSRGEVAEILRDPPPEIRGMRVAELMKALPGFGRTKCETVMKRAGAKPTITIEACWNIESVIDCLMAWPGRPK